MLSVYVHFGIDRFILFKKIILLVCTQAFQSYVRDLACPLAGQPRQEILDWIIGLAVRWVPLFY